MRVLLIEDDQVLSAVLVAKLTEQHYVVDAAFDGKTGWEYATGLEYDLILLDVILPELDGISLCRKLRSQHNTTPILLLTGRDNSADKVMGLDAGADDYIVKPFNFEELSARIRAILRRGNESLPPVLTWGELCLDPSTCEVRYHHHLLSLTPKEYAILELFLRNRQRVFSCRAILDQLWALEESPTEDTIRAHIKGLRQKLKTAGAPTTLIETVYGLGYRLKAESPETPELPRKEPQKVSVAVNPPAPSQSPAPSPQQLHEAVAKIWERFQDKIINQINVLDAAVTALETGTLDAELRMAAYRESHKLAGSLGTFGIAEGSTLARKIEDLLQGETPLTSDQITDIAQWVQLLRQTLAEKQMNTSAMNAVVPPPEPLIPSSTTPLVLIISNDPQNFTSDSGTPLLPAPIPSELRIKVLPNLDTALDQITTISPHSSAYPQIILLDLDTLDPRSMPRDVSESMHPSCIDRGNPSDLAQFLNYLSQQTPSIPVLVLTSQGDFSARIHIARLGVHTFLQKPIAPPEIITTIVNVLRETQTDFTKVMIVDDDQTFLMTLQTLLNPLKIKTVILDNPLEFWETLKRERPDLLVLDIEMPHLNGIELCRVVRTEPRWSQLPILFLTAHTDPDIIHRAFAAGADDLITKPTSTETLISRIVNRLKRTKTLLSQWEGRVGQQESGDKEGGEITFNLQRPDNSTL